jgi:hypothetical protein
MSSIDCRIQMVGTQRSGSNLLRLMFAQISDVFAPPSTHMIADLSPIVPNYEPLQDRQNFEALAVDVARLIEANVLEWPAPTPTSHEVLEACRGNSLEYLFCAVLDSGAVRHGCTKWLSKDLEHVHYLESLSKKVPDLCVIHLVRDPRDVALSLAKAPIGPKDPRAIALAWARDQAAALEYRCRRATARWMEIRYESLVANTESVMNAACAQFGLQYHSRIFDFYLRRDAQIAHKMSPLWRNLAEPVSSNYVGRFRAAECRAFVEEVEAACYDMLIAMGYEPLYASRQRCYSRDEIDSIASKDERLRTTSHVVRTPELLERKIQRQAILAELSGYAQQARL